MEETHKKLVLCPLQAILGVVEGKPYEQTTRDVEDDLRDEVRRVTPVRKEVALRKADRLMNP